MHALMLHLENVSTIKVNTDDPLKGWLSSHIHVFNSSHHSPD